MTIKTFNYGKQAFIYYNYAVHAECRYVEGEKTIGKCASWSFHYANDVINGPWPEGEWVISRDADWSYWYAKDIIGGPWPKGEEAISKDAMRSYHYAKYVIGGRFEKGEEAILGDEEFGDKYKKNFEISYVNQNP
jgi:hypothetical protein